MDKNTITGFVLIALVLIGFSYFSQPSKQEKEQMRIQDSISMAKAQQEAAAQRTAAAKAKADAATADTTTAKDTTGLFGSAKNGVAQTIILQNKVMAVAFNSKGGMVSKVILKNYRDQSRKHPVTLYNEANAKMAFILAGRTENLRTSDYYFTPTDVSDSTVTMQLKSSTGGALSITYKLRGDNYMMDMAVSATGLSNQFAPSASTMNIEWSDSIRQQEKGFSFENRYSTVTYKKKGEGTDYLSETQAKDEEVPESLDWVAFKNQFFSAIFIAEGDFNKAHLTSTPLQEGSGFLKYYTASMQTAFDPTGAKPSSFQFFFGPNQYRLLQSMNEVSGSKKDLALEDLVYLGWPIIRYINRYFTIYVFDWLTQMGFSMGIVLLLITILLRVIVYPTTRKSYRSSAKMRVLRPKMEEITKKYPNKEDAMKKQQEMMALYSKYGASPMGGCLPMLIQMPIWIAMFNFVPNAIELRQQSFLWADDLSTYDDVLSWSTHVWGIGNHLSIFCLLFCLSNLAYSYLTMRQQKDSMVGEQAEQMKIMQWMMMFMPLFFFFMFNDYSSGLNYYYFISLLFSAVSMWYLRKTTDDEKLLAKMEKYYEENKNNPTKKSNMMQRLAAMQKQVEEQQKKKGK